MPIGGRRIGWFSPDPRGVLPLEQLVVTHSLRRSLRRFEVTVDRAFPQVIAACGDPRRPNGWINRKIVAAYTHLHHLGWAHSVETWADGTLVGGLYGVSLGGLFAGESMFHHRTDASKVALVHLVELLRTGSADTLLDVQWRTPHLASLGVIGMSRCDYAARLARAIVAEPPAFALVPADPRPASDPRRAGPSRK